MLDQWVKARKERWVSRWRCGWGGNWICDEEMDTDWTDRTVFCFGGSCKAWR